MTSLFPDQYARKNNSQGEQATLSILQARVVDENGENQSGVKLKIKVEPIENTAGHSGSVNHAPRPLDRLAYGRLIGNDITQPGFEIEGTTSDNGYKFVYASAEASGDYKIKISCADKNCTQRTPDTIWVGVKGLVTLETSDRYALIGQTDFHSDNHYVSETTKSKINELVDLYNEYRISALAQNPSLPLLHLNDASLIRGGLFDIKGTWKRKHELHRVGTDIDVRANDTDGAIPESIFPLFEQEAKLANCKPTIEFPDKINGKADKRRHYHLSCK